MKWLPKLFEHFRAGLRGKDLREGMNVVCLHAPDRSPLASSSGTPLTVEAIDQPFILFRSQYCLPSMFWGVMAGTMFRGERKDAEYEWTTTLVDVRGHRFKEVSEKYVNAVRKNIPDPVPSSEFPDTIE